MVSQVFWAGGLGVGRFCGWTRPVVLGRFSSLHVCLERTKALMTLMIRIGLRGILHSYNNGTAW